MYIRIVESFGEMLLPVKGQFFLKQSNKLILACNNALFFSNLSENQLLFNLLR